MKYSLLLVLSAAALLIISCGTQRKLESLRKGGISASIGLPEEKIMSVKADTAVHRDTIVLTGPDGNRLILMKAVKDEESGEMVATETLDAAIVTARFRNVAERHGKVDLCFDIRVPRAMQDSKWQLRFYPSLHVFDDSLRLDAVIVTGEDYRKGQLRGYQQYRRFVDSIITDSLEFVNMRALEIFLERNLPQVFRYKNDTTFVSDSVFLSAFGVSETEAVKHYTNVIAWKINERRKAMMGRMYGRYVKVPIMTEGIRLDTVMRSMDGDFVYKYIQTINVTPGLRKAGIRLDGEIWESDRKLYSMNGTEPLTFYISSLSTFTDNRVKYIDRIIERRAEANTACYIDFREGSAVVDLSLAHNRSEEARIRSNIVQLLEDREYDMDSIVIAAWASPEGSLKYNTALSGKRAQAVAAHFRNFMVHYADSAGIQGAEDIGFRSHTNGENWPMLSYLADVDSTLSPSDVKTYMKHLETQDPDQREAALRKERFYPYMRSVLYPRLRTVRFGFFLHRKGMIRDTVHTTEPDTVYMKGVKALQDMEYKKALDILRDYRDINTAIAFMALEYNASAMGILQDLPQSPRADYLKALLYARSGEPEKAIRAYLDACREDRSLVFRGNLDPEIKALTNTYSIEL